MPDPLPPDLPSPLAARYASPRLLGTGAMGQVLGAHDTVIQRDVAVKLVRWATADPGTTAIRARFRREAAAAGRLAHPRIVAVHDYGEDGDCAWIVMEHVAGGTLKERLERGPPPSPREAIEVAAQMLAALDYAHGRGVIHRDIKPANVMLAPDGAKLIDFGIARIDASTATSLTMTGMVMGTIGYMAPEQFTDDPVDARADLWAVGVVLYEMLTATRPFAGSFTVAMQKILHVDPPPPTQIATGLPMLLDAVRLDAVLARALAKRPEDRFQTAAAFAAALEACAAAAPAPSPHSAGATPARRPGLRPALAATAIAATALAGLAAWWQTRPPAAPAAVTAAAAPPLPAPQPSTPTPPVPALPVPTPQVVTPAVPAPPVPAPPVVTPAVPEPPVPAPPVVTPAVPEPPVPAPPVVAPAVPEPPIPAPPVVTPAVPEPPVPAPPVVTPTVPEPPVVMPPLAAPASPIPAMPASVRPPAAAEPPLPQPSPPQPTIPPQPLAREQVATAQTLLSELGFDAGPADGVIGARSRTAMERFAIAALYPDQAEFDTANLARLTEIHQAFQRLTERDATSPRGAAASATPSARGRYERGWAAEARAADDDDAAYWYGLAAREHDLSAMVQLGLLLTRGRGQPADPVGAGLLWRLAAARGDTTAAYNLGAMLEVGFGVARNPVWARYWYAMAASAGHPQAREGLKRVSGQ